MVLREPHVSDGGLGGVSCVGHCAFHCAGILPLSKSIPQVSAIRTVVGDGINRKTVLPPPSEFETGPRLVDPRRCRPEPLGMMPRGSNEGGRATVLRELEMDRVPAFRRSANLTSLFHLLVPPPSPVGAVALYLSFPSRFQPCPPNSLPNAISKSSHSSSQLISSCPRRRSPAAICHPPFPPRFPDQNQRSLPPLSYPFGSSSRPRSSCTTTTCTARSTSDTLSFLSHGISPLP